MRSNIIVVGAVLSLAAAGCRQQEEQSAPARGEIGRLAAVAATTSAGAKARTARAAAEPTAATVTPLALAKPSGSALIHAAYHRTGQIWEQMMFLCDGVNGKQVRLLTTPNARGLSQLWTYSKSGFAAAHEEVRIGEEDPGAGQITRALTGPSGRPVGSVHSISPGILGDAKVTTLPTLTRITVGSEITPCRWMERGRVLFVDARRTVLVTAEPGGGFTYRSFDHAKPGTPIGSTSSTATAIVKGGRLVRSRLGTETYEFRIGPWTYRLTASANNDAPGATLAVLRAGDLATSSVAVAYEMAAARKE